MNHKALLVAMVAALALTVTAQAGNPSLCTRDGWQSAQSSTGASFASMNECVREREVYRPSLVSDRSAVQAEEFFLLLGRGFHASAEATLYFAETGYESYFSVTTVTGEDGSTLFAIRFSGCGEFPPYDITLTLVDSFGVHAATEITLC